SPACSFGVKEKRVPQLRQKPSASPGRPSRARPTGCWQFGQNRLLSGTCGSASMAMAGSCVGTGGTSTRPAPRFPRDDLPVLACVPRVPALPRVPTLPPVLPPVPAEAGDEPRSWSAAVTSTGAAAIPQTVQYPSSMVPPQPGWVQVAGAAGAAVAAGAAAGAAAIPQTVQYPSSMVPPQPGCVHWVVVVVTAAASARSAPGSPADNASPRPRRPRGHTAPSTAVHGPGHKAC